jgi:hypothetical protein
VVETHHGFNEGKIEVMTLGEIEEFLDIMFEHEVRFE